MIMNIFMRRRAQRFAELVDDPLAADPAAAPHHHARSGNTTRGTDDALAPLVRLGHGVSQRADELTDPLAIDPDFQASLRRRLMAEAAAHGVGAGRIDAEDEPAARSAAPHPVHPHHRRTVPQRRRRLVLVGCAAAGAFAIAAIAAVSSSSVPGDPLYDVKRSTERAQLALAGSDVNSGELYLQFARTRAGEAMAVRRNPGELASTLTEMDRETRKGVSLLTGTAVSRHDAASLTEVAAFAADQRPKLVTLLSDLNGASRTRALKSLALVDEASQRAADLREQLACTEGQPEVRDGLGPMPRSCEAQAGGSVGRPSNPGTGTSGVASPAPNPPAGRHSTGPSPSPSTAPSSPGATGPGLPLPTGGVPSASASPTPGHGNGDNGGVLGTIGKILGGLL